MKYIFLLLCAIGWQLLPAEVSYAQKDTFSVSFKNLPLIEDGEYIDRINHTDYHVIDSVLFSQRRIYIFDSLQRKHDTLLYFMRNDLPKLTIVFDKSAEKFMFLSFYSNVLQEASDYDYLDFSMLNINASENGDNFSSGIRGDSISSIGLSFEDRLYAPISFHSWTNYTSFSTGKFTDSTVITFSLSKQKLLRVEHSGNKPQQGIYPNPASNSIHFSIDEAQINGDVTDMIGRKVLSYKLSQPMNEISLDISSLPPGIYYLRAGNQMQKFVVAR